VCITGGLGARSQQCPRHAGVGHQTGGEAADEHGPDGSGLRRPPGDSHDLGNLAQLFCGTRDYSLRQVGRNGTTFDVQQARAYLGPDPAVTKCISLGLSDGSQICESGGSHEPTATTAFVISL